MTRPAVPPWPYWLSQPAGEPHRLTVQVRSNADPEADFRRVAAKGGTIPSYRNAVRGLTGSFADIAIEAVMGRNPNVPS